MTASLIYIIITKILLIRTLQNYRESIKAKLLVSHIQLSTSLANNILILCAWHHIDDLVSWLYNQSFPFLIQAARELNFSPPKIHLKKTWSTFIALLNTNFIWILAIQEIDNLQGTVLPCTTLPFWTFNPSTLLKLEEGRIFSPHLSTIS